jgi:hypothetical protein
LPVEEKIVEALSPEYPEIKTEIEEDKGGVDPAEKSNPYP